MAYYVQMKDDVVFAYVESETPIENSIVLEDGIDPNTVLAKKLVNNEWVDAPLIYFVEQFSPNGIIERINSTVYLSDAKGEIIPPHVGLGWKKENDEWVDAIKLQSQQRMKEEKELLQREINAIINSRPYPSWNWVDGQWTSPVDMPNGNPDDYFWDEATMSWQEIIDLEQPNNEITS